MYVSKAGPLSPELREWSIREPPAAKVGISMAIAKAEGDSGGGLNQNHQENLPEKAQAKLPASRPPIPSKRSLKMSRAVPIPNL